MDRNTAQALIGRGYVAIVYAAYDYADKQSGYVISKHKTYEAAEKKSNDSSMWGVKLLDQVA